MSPDLQADVTDEMRHADNALRAAEALLNLGLPADAASRAYYAAFHAARALLFSIGLRPWSHEAVRELVGRHFVLPNRLAREHAKHLAHLESLRLAGDYQTAFALGVDDLRPELEKARAFVAAARALLDPELAP